MKTILVLASVIALGCEESALTRGDAGDSSGDVGVGGGADAAGTLGTWSVVASGTDRDLYRVRGSGPEDAWAVGAGGTILHWSGAAWSGVPSGTAEDLYDVWGSGPSDVWAVGAKDTILHWNGSAWSGVQVGTGRDLYGVWGSGPDDIWAVGAECSSTVSGEQTKNSCSPNSILHWDGSLWSVVSRDGGEALYGVWGSGRDDVWAVGADCWSTVTGNVREWACGAGMLHWDGSLWSAVPSGTAGAIVDVWGSGPADVWALSLGFWTVHPAILHWDGSDWAVAARDYGEQGTWGSGPNDVWAVGGGDILHWNGADWSASTSAASVGLLGVWGSGPGDVWAVGYAGTILHHESRP